MNPHNVQKYIFNKLNIEILDYEQEKINLYKFVQYLLNNRILYQFLIYLELSGDLNKYPILSEIKKIGDNKKVNFNATIKLIKNLATLNSLDYKIPKTFREIDYINSDIDLLVKKKDITKWQSIFYENNFRNFSHKIFFFKHDDQFIFNKKEKYKIDLSYNFNWQNLNFFNHDDFWVDSNNFDEIEDLIFIGSIIFKRMHFTINDLVRYRKINNFNYRYIESFGWEKLLLNFLKIIDKKLENKKSLYPLHLFELHKEAIKTTRNMKKIMFNYWSYLYLAYIRYYFTKKLPFEVKWYPNKYDNLLKRSLYIMK